MKQTHEPTDVTPELVDIISRMTPPQAPSEQTRQIIDAWKAQQAYPYDGAPTSPLEEIERQVFDIVAVHIVHHLPDFRTAPQKDQAFQLRMLRQAIEKSPDELQIILDEVLRLPPRQRDELASLLRETSLACVIAAAKTVADRAKFLTGLEALLFDPDAKQRLKERAQLHRIVAQNCWLFGDEFNLSVDDRSLTEVLVAHKRQLDEDIVIDEPVKHVSKTRGIVDLMLSKAIQRHRPNQLTHLVVELKAPKVAVGTKEITQIENYALSVMRDPRFKHVGTHWTFWVISDDLSSYADFRRLDDFGLILAKDNLSIYAMTWGQLLDGNRARLKFIQDRLQLQVDKTAALQLLRSRYAAWLNGVFDAPSSDTEATAVA